MSILFSSGSQSGGEKNAMLRVKQRRKRRGSGYRIYSTATIKTGDRLVNAVPRFIAATSKKITVAR